MIKKNSVTMQIVSSHADNCEKMKEGNCHDFSLGLTTKARGMERCRPKVQPGIHIHTLRSVGKCEGMSPHGPKGAPTFGVGVLMDSQIFIKPFEGSKFIGLKNSLYHWKDFEM